MVSRSGDFVINDRDSLYWICAALGSNELLGYSSAPYGC